VWRTPSILAWQNWLRSLLTELVDRGAIHQALLGAAEERLLWQMVVESSEHGQNLLAHRSAARAAADAARICARFDIDETELADSEARETRIFAQWQQRFHEHLETHEAIAPYAIDDVVAFNLDTIVDVLPRELVLVGFDEINPAGQRVLARARELGIQVTRLLDERSPAVHQQRVEAADSRAEVYAICSWAFEQLRVRNKTARLGIAAPDVNTLRIALDTPLASALSEFPGAYQDATAQSLKDEPAIHDALALLRACAEPVDAEQLCNMLRPYHAFGVADWARNVELETSLLESLPRKVRLAQLLQHWPDTEEGASNFAQLANQLAQASSYAPPSVWIRRFAQWLTLTGWPGPHGGPQMLEALAPAFAQVARLERMLARCTSAKAVAELEAVLADAPPLGRTSGRVQLMSMDDAAQARVDALWVAGVDEETWPRSARPVALLTVGLQLSRGVPGVTATLATARDRDLSTQLLHSAADVTVSHALASGDRTLRVSPLFASLSATRNSDAEDGGTSSASSTPSSPALFPITTPLAATQGAELLEWLDDWHGVPVPDGEHMRGGTRLLADQSQCPFRAYALHRLGITVRELPVLGLDRRDAGSLLHRSLEFIWDGLSDSATLHATPEEALRSIVSNAIGRAIAELQTRAHALADPHLADLESGRLTRLCNEWLAFEKERPHAFKVLLQERRERTRVGPLELNIQIDRIDELDDGTQAVIDYKSGEVSSARWFDERLGEPQVPLYATGRDENVSAALIAQVKFGKLRFQGAVATKSARPASARSLRVAKDEGEWREWLSRWREQLAVLATEAADGLATVTPNSYPATCRYCDVRPACRVNGINRNGEDDVDAE
jgi:probable DNA repair protein